MEAGTKGSLEMTFPFMSLGPRSSDLEPSLGHFLRERVVQLDCRAVAHQVEQDPHALGVGDPRSKTPSKSFMGPERTRTRSFGSKLQPSSRARRPASDSG